MIRNYQNPEGTIALVDSTDVNVPVIVFTSTTTGGPINSPTVPGQVNAVVTMVLCNTGAPDLTDETVNSVTVSVYLVPEGETAHPGNRIVSSLVIPAGETVFFSDEKIVLNSGDEIQIGTDTASLLAVTVSTLPV